jgi:hypothetical protein
MGQSAGQGQAADIQKMQAQHATDLFQVGGPGMQLALSSFISDLGQPGQIPESVKSAFDKINTLTNTQFSNEEAAAPSTIAQQMKSSGYRGAAGAQDQSANATLAQLEKNRLGALNTNQINETNQALSTQQYDLSQIFGIVSGTTNASNMFAGNALGATGYNNANPLGGAASGALSGAAGGASLGPWGALVGGVAGGAAGYFSGGGR